MGDVFNGITNTLSGVSTGVGKSFTPQNQYQFDQSMGGVQANQNALAQALLAQSQGQGPNPAQNMLNQATNQNIQQNAGFTASQKGINPALAARLASQNQANMSQQAAGQGALMGAQQQLNAQQQLGNLYGQQAGENIAGQQINAGVTAQNAAANQKTAGGFWNGLSGGLLNKGGEVKAYAGGGQVDASQQIANQMLSSAGVTSWPIGVPDSKGPSGSKSPFDSPLDMSGGTAMAGGPMDAIGGAGGAGAGDALGGAGAVALAYRGGKIPAHLEHIAKIYHPQAFIPASNTEHLKAKGGKVPGKAQIPGDSVKNDTVKTMLSPGEMVIPRSVMQSKDPAEAAKAFVAQKLKEKSKDGSGDAKKDFHMALKKAISSRKEK
jgi:hypothetical protein